MKGSRIGRILALGTILALLMLLLPTPVLATGYIYVYPKAGKIGTYFDIDGSGFSESDVVLLYLSNQEAELGDEINEEVTAYQQVLVVSTNESGYFDHTYSFRLPDALIHGEDTEDVHDGDYYIYATYAGEQYIIAITEISVIDGEISLDIEEGTVGTEVEVSGQGLRPNQAIIIKYDGEAIAIASGDSQTDKNGNFSCTTVIPTSPAGDHIISALDESGNTPEASFTVIPRITLDPSEQLTGETVQVSGDGFGKRQDITITLDGEEVDTIPLPLTTDHYGSFEGSFIVPAYGSYGTKELEVSDGSQNKVEAQLTILGGIYLSPTTSLTSPGYVGMELTVHGAGFNVGATVTISYGNDGQTIPLDTVTAPDGAFHLKVVIPPSLAGSHDITASDGTSTATAVFIMESQPPPSPTPSTPEIAGTSQASAYFDWSDVSDDSGVSYNLQVALDADFNAILLDKAGLTASEYTLAEEEKLEPAEKEAYYWRVKAVDGALNESQWTNPRLFYVGFSWTALPVWAWYVFGGVGIIVLGMLGFWLWRRKVRV